MCEHQAYRWLYRLLFCVALSGVVYTIGCEKKQCVQNSDCPQNQHCLLNQCQPKSSEKPPVGRDAGEPTIERTSIQEEPITKEPKPPTWDKDWKEKRFERPEAFLEGKRPSTAGVRKKGETCNPGLTALRSDRCAQDLVCVSPFLGPVGVCRESCKDASSACPSGMRCAPFASIETAKPKGFACSPTAKLGFACSWGRPCEKGFRCAVGPEPNSGVCRKACEKRADCGADWCASIKTFTGSSTACLRFAPKLGDACSSGTICGDGLVCVGPSGHKTCLKRGCGEQTPCPSGTTCVPVKDIFGKPLYSACFPLIEEGKPCHSGNRCKKGALCTRFSSQPNYLQCVKECTKDAKLCSAKEQCVTLSSRKGCLKVVQEGESCEGSTTCATGLKCISVRTGGARFCLRDCAANTSMCTAQTSCVKLSVGAASHQVCLASCDPKAPNCTLKHSTCLSEQGQDLCLPHKSQITGTRKKGETCDPYIGAQESTRCIAGLQCLTFAEGSFCARTCDPKASNSVCGTEACMYASDLKQFICATSVAKGAVCHPSQGSVCAQGHVCVHPFGIGKGVCESVQSKKKGELCAERFATCETSSICSGHALVPFRWICRTPCSSGSKSCSNREICLQVGEGSACFESCDSTTCSNTTQSCQVVQTKKVCL